MAAVLRIIYGMALTALAAVSSDPLHPLALKQWSSPSHLQVAIPCLHARVSETVIFTAIVPLILKRGLSRLGESLICW